MKHLLIILAFWISQSFAQTAPAAFRCIAVLPNGDVALTWLPPADPANSFASYVIFYSPTPNGNFTPVGAQGSITNNTFTHTGSSTNIQSCYYFIETRWNVGSGTVSINSNTLHSIFLNIITTNGAPDIKLQFNTVSTPNLPSYTGPNTIYKEYPVGTWNTLAVTNAQSYFDTISVCSATIHYQVTVQDNSGCLSASNIQGGNDYRDSKSPNKPVVDSISVLDNGNVVLAWQIPRDEDIETYVIYQAIVDPVSGNLTYPPIANLFGRNNTSFTYTPGSEPAPYALFVAAKDSCTNLGNYDTLPKTMELKVRYDSCRYQSVLYWNPYRNMPKGLLEYRIYYSVNGAEFSAIGTSSTTTFLHTNVNPGQSICYYVRAFNTDRTVSSSSNRLCFYANQAQAPGYLYMRTATVLKKNSVTVRLFLDTAVICSGIALFRSENGIDYRRVAFLPTGKEPNHSYDDDSAQSSSKSYFYRAQVVDNCGNLRTQSNISQTMLLKVQEDKELIFTKRLSWNFYDGFSGQVDRYKIFRIINGEWPSDPIVMLSPFVNTYVDQLEDEASKGAKVEYVVEAIEGVGNVYGFAETSNSNPAAVYMEGQIFVPDAFAPEGKNKIWLPITHFVDKTEYRLMIFSRWGNKIFETGDDTQGWKGDNCEGGVYVYLISYKNSRGEYLESKGTFLLYR